MWRRLIFEVASARKVAVRRFAEETTGQTKNDKKGADDQNTKTGTSANQDKEQPEEDIQDKFSAIKSVFKTGACMYLVELALKKENDRRGNDLQVIMLGKRGSGFELVGDALLGPGYREKYKKKLLTAQQNNEHDLIRNDVSSITPEVKGYNHQYRRNITLTNLYPDEVTSAPPYALTSLTTSEDQLVVFCFPVSHRFTDEDANLLKTYLKYRRNEEKYKITVAFTYYGSADFDFEDYIEKLPNQFKTFLNKCENPYFLVSSSTKLSDQDKLTVKELVEPVPTTVFSQDIFETLIVYFFTRMKFGIW